MDVGSVLPKHLLEHPQFRSDVDRLLRMNAAQLELLRECLPSRPADLEDPEFVKSAASRLEIDRGLYRSLAATVKLLLVTISHHEIPPAEMVKSLEEMVSGFRLSDEQRATLVSFFTPGEHEAIPAGVRAFAFGNSFGGASFKPLVAPIANVDSEELAVGGCLSIDYFDPVGERRSVTFNLSAEELSHLIFQLDQGLISTRSLASRIGGRVEK